MNPLDWLFRALSLLPLAALQRIGAAAGWLFYYASRKQREKVLRNLLQAGIQQPQRLALQSTIQEGICAFETIYVWTRKPADIAKRCEVFGWQQVLDRLQQRGANASLMVLLPHLGSFETCGRFISSQRPITALYRPARKAWVEQLLQKYRQSDNMPTVPTNKAGVRELLRELQRGGTVGMLPDQVPSFGDGLWLDWFGKPAYTMTLPARLASKTNTEIVMFAVLRKGFGQGFAVHCQPLLAVGETITDPKLLTERINQATQALILRFPEQYYWSYDRYKVPAGAKAQDLES